MGKICIHCRAVSVHRVDDRMVYAGVPRTAHASPPFALQRSRACTEGSSVPIIEVLSGLAPNYHVFLVLRLLYGIGMGGEWGIGGKPLTTEAVKELAAGRHAA